MRRVVVSEFVTLDGVVEEPQKWSLKYWNDDIAAFKTVEIEASDALLLGRVTYEGRSGRDRMNWPADVLTAQRTVRHKPGRK